MLLFDLLRKVDIHIREVVLQICDDKFNLNFKKRISDLDVLTRHQIKKKISSTQQQTTIFTMNFKV